MTIHVTPIPKLTSFATPDLTLTTANAAGSAGVSTTIRSDASLLVYDANNPAAVAAAAAVGSAATAARRDHVHAGSSVAAGVKAYCQITNAAGAPATGSFNISGGTKNSTGNYTMAWDTDFSSVNYTVVACSGPTGAGDSRWATTYPQDGATCDVFVYNASGITVSDVMLVALGASA